MEKEQYSAIELQAIDLQKSWGRCGDTANYLASYMAHEFQNPDKALNVIGVVVNELLEYLFDACERDSSIIMSLSLSDDSVSILCQTKFNPEFECQQYIDFSKQLKDDWIGHIQDSNQLRFAFLIKDYDCHIHFQKNHELDTLQCNLQVPS